MLKSKIFKTIPFFIIVLCSSCLSPEQTAPKKGISATAKEICQSIEKDVYLAITPEDCEKALKTIETRMYPYPANSAVSQRGVLAKAQILLRLDRKREAIPLFQSAIQKHWKDAFSIYYASLLEVKDFQRAAEIEYQRLIREAPYNAYYKDLPDFSRFNRTVGLFKVHHPSLASIDYILPYLPDSRRFPHFLIIAKAFCQGYGGNVSQAITGLTSLESQIRHSWSREADQYKYIPLYKITILAKAGHPASELQADYNEYVLRCNNDIRIIYDGISEMIESFNIKAAETSKITALSSLLIKSPLFKDPKNQAKLTEDNLAHIYDVHSQGLLFQGKNQEAAEYDKLVYEKYYPQTFAGAVCGIRYANHLSGQGNVYEAVNLLTKITEENPGNHNYTQIAGNVGLANIAIMHREYPKAMAYIQRALDRASKYTSGQFYSWYQHCLAMKKQVEKLMQP